MTDCDFSEFNMLKRLIIYTNPLTKIKLSKSIKYIDLSETKILDLDNIYNVEDLVLNNSPDIKIIPKSDKLKNAKMLIF